MMELIMIQLMIEWWNLLMRLIWKNLHDGTYHDPTNDRMMELIEVEAFAYWYGKTYHDPTNDRTMELIMIQLMIEWWNLSWSN